LLLAVALFKAIVIEKYHGSQITQVDNLNFFYVIDFIDVYVRVHLGLRKIIDIKLLIYQSWVLLFDFMSYVEVNS